MHKTPYNFNSYKKNAPHRGQVLNSDPSSMGAKIGQILLLAFLGLLAVAQTAFARDLSYDRYAPIYEPQPPAPSAVHKIAVGLLPYLLEPLRIGTDKSIDFVEKYHLDNKFTWAYDKIKSYGISPKIGLFSFGSRAVGADIDFVKLARLRSKFPDITVSGSIDYANKLYFKTSAQIGLERIAGTGLYAKAVFNYHDRPQEYFYGIGPSTSRGDGGVYSYEETSVGPNAGYQWGEDTRLDLSMLYRNINIGEGHTSGRLQARDLVNPTTLDGSYGDRMFTYQAGLIHDTRNHKGNSDKGGLRSFTLSYNDGIDQSKANYLKSQLELSQYMQLLSPRRVLAVRFYGEHNGELNSGQVPFHQLAKLGGYGRQNYMSDTLRGYGPNRFFDKSSALFNIEYRYNIWHYRDFKLDTVLFWDEGQVFSQISRFKLRNFRESYGGGFRVSIADLTVLSVELAHADEGTNIYVRTETPF